MWCAMGRRIWLRSLHLEEGHGLTLPPGIMVSQPPQHGDADKRVPLGVSSKKGLHALSQLKALSEITHNCILCNFVEQTQVLSSRILRSTRSCGFDPLESCGPTIASQLHVHCSLPVLVFREKEWAAFVKGESIGKFLSTRKIGSAPLPATRLTYCLTPPIQCCEGMGICFKDGKRTASVQATQQS